MSKETGYDPMPEAAPQSTCEIIREEIVHLKWRVLVCACFLTFGSYYIYDFPGSIGTGDHDTIQSYFHDHGKSYTQEMNQALYSVYSWPNTVLAVFGGLLIDKFLGLRKAMTLFVTLVFLGSVVFLVGILTKTYALLLVGRLVFGLGGESLSVAQSAFVARWFKEGRGMALAFGITISFARVGSSFNFLFSPKFAASDNVETAVAMGCIACGISMISCAFLVAMDVYGSRKGLVPPESKETGEPFKLSQIRDMPLLFWLASLVCVSVYCAIFPLIGIAKNFFQVKYGISQDTASSYVSVYQFVCAGASPISGGIVDNVGRFSIWMVVAGAGFTAIHLIFVVASPPPWIMMAIMGLVYSVLVSSLWPAVPYVVQGDLVGLAYGIMTAMQNTGLATWPLVSGAILDAYTPSNSTMTNATEAPTSAPKLWQLVVGDDDKKKTVLPTEEGYKYTELFFMATAAAGVVVAFILFLVDKRGAGVLGASPSRREEIKKDMLPLVEGDVN